MPTKTIANTTATRKTLKTIRTKPLSEKHIQETCSAFLELDGWRCIRTDLPHLRGLGVSEPGMADNLYIRYIYRDKADEEVKKEMFNMSAVEVRAEADVMFIEWKKKGGKAAQHQQDWHAKERACGALTLIAGEDFTASIEGFCKWYAASGLQRKKVSIPR